METPLVSICSLTYNHAPFIRQCLDGFLMQQCNFPIEIIINDDCSTDGTTEIIREYAEKYPDVIFPIFHEENLYSQGIRGFEHQFLFPKARGKYIALCEGDDYWTDPLKLQKQVDFLESHPDYSMCFHKAKVLVQDGREYVDYFSKLEEREYKAEEILTRWIVPTASILFRADVHVPLHKDFRTGDVVIHAACLDAGRVFCMMDEMSVYRLHEGGWSNHGFTEEYSCIVAIPHRLAMMECFPRLVTKEMRKRAAFCCTLLIINYSKYKGRVPGRYIFKTLRYAKLELLAYMGVIIRYKIKRMFGMEAEPPL